MTNILTIDVEDWYHLNYSSMSAYSHRLYESRVRANTIALLTALNARQARATFFFLGSVAEADPALVREVQDQGHEIASHGYGHQLVYRQTREQFHMDVAKSIEILQKITGQRVLGYRAPSWSFSKKTPWALEVLSDLGLVYSSSVFPFTTYLYGSGHAPLEPTVTHVNGHKICEIPATVLGMGHLRIPFGGGFYFRVFPYWLTHLAMRLTYLAGRPAMFYLHPREIDPGQPRLPLPLVDKFVTYANLRPTLQKLKKLLADCPTITVSDYLRSVGIMNG